MNYDAKCPVPECAKPWSEDFLLDALPRTWMYGEYRKHREKFCLDQERARLPETQEDAKVYMTCKEFVDRLDAQKTALKEQMAAMPESQAVILLNTEKLQKAKDMRNYCHNNRIGVHYDPTNNPVRAKMEADLQKLHRRLEPLLEAQKEATKELSKAYRKLERTEGYAEARYSVHNWGKAWPYGTEDAGAGAAPVTKTSNWSFTMKCPAEECQGFIGLNWVCGLCSVKVCEDCREIKETVHTCDPAKKESVKALVKEAKPCPKCAAQISKIDGCDQMWCTQCHTAFSWRSGAIEEHVHNPHYYEWMRRSGQAIPRADAPADMQCMTPRQILRQAELHLLQNQELFPWIQPISHILLHSTFELRYRIRSDPATDEQKRILRVKRLLNLIDDRKWGMALELLNIQKRRYTDANDILQMFINASTDILREAISVPSGAAKQLRDLAEYTNSQITKHNAKYKNTMDLIQIPV